MQENLESASWYKVSGLAPRLRTQSRIRRQIHRGQIWYVIEDKTSGKFHRFSPTSFLIICMMDGELSVQQIWEEACAQLEEDVLTQDDIIRLLAQLHQADMLHTNVRPDNELVNRRIEKLARRKKILSFINPLVVRVPLFDPDDFLNATFPLVRPLFSIAGLCAFLGILFYALVLAGLHWSELTENLSDRILAAESLVLLVLTYPVIKVFHELGHAYLVKKWGGEVHEMGIMFLVFMPVPYVDASAASAFREKHKRVMVGAAGVIVELLLASIAMYVWSTSDDSFVRAAAFNVMFIGGVSTLLFNGNPLLRFDGYYVLSDLIEIQNLGVRSNRYLGYLIQKHLFGVQTAASPVVAPGEAKWFFFYSISAFLYRLTIMFSIITFVAGKFFVIGTILAIWGIIMMIVFPLARHFWFLLSAPILSRTRGRAFAVTASVLALLLVPLIGLPVPYATVAEGVVWVDGKGALYAKADGEVTTLLSAPNSVVAEGQPLLALYDPILDANVEVLEAEVEGLNDKLSAAIVNNAVETAVLRQQLEFAVGEMNEFKAVQRDLVVYAGREGELFLPGGRRLIGAQVRRGQYLGYIVDRQNPSIRVVVLEDDAELVAMQTEKVEVRFVENLDRIYRGEVRRQLPLITDELPSPVLSTQGGGSVVLDPTDPENIRAFERVWELEIYLTEDATLRGLGARAYVRFDHGQETIANRAYRGLRQFFIRQFNV